MFNVQSNVPTPSATKASYPFASMEVGDSFEYSPDFRLKVPNAASLYGKRSGKKFRTAVQPNGMFRCWRVA